MYQADPLLQQYYMLRLPVAASMAAIQRLGSRVPTRTAIVAAAAPSYGHVSKLGRSLCSSSISQERDAAIQRLPPWERPAARRRAAAAAPCAAAPSGAAAGGSDSDSQPSTSGRGDGDASSGGSEHGLRVVLVHPQIPQNTGNIARTCAATGAALHLVGPLGFKIDDKNLKRAGLDYWEHVCVDVHDSWAGFMAKWRAEPGPKRLVAYTVYGSSYYAGPEFTYQRGDWLLFGAETTGLPPEAHADILESGGALVKIPISTVHVRSLNLAVSAGIGVFEALRQLGPHEVAPRDDSGLKKPDTVMAAWRQQQGAAEQQGEAEEQPQAAP